MLRQHEMLPRKLPDILADEPITFFLKIPETKMKDLNEPFTIKGNKRSSAWKFSVAPDQIQKGKNLNQLWARELVADLSFQKAIGFLDAMQYQRWVTGLGLTHHLITEFTSLVAVDPYVSRDQSSPLLSQQIAHNIPDGWEHPETVRKIKMMQQHYKQLNQGPMEALYKLNEDTAKALNIHFVKTATNKNLFLLIAILLFLGSFFLFRIERRIA